MELINNIVRLNSELQNLPMVQGQQPQGWTDDRLKMLLFEKVVATEFSSALFTINHTNMNWHDAEELIRKDIMRESLKDLSSYKKDVDSRSNYFKQPFFENIATVNQIQSSSSKQFKLKCYNCLSLLHSADNCDQRRCDKCGEKWASFTDSSFHRYYDCHLFKAKRQYENDNEEISRKRINLVIPEIDNDHKTYEYFDEESNED